MSRRTDRSATTGEKMSIIRSIDLISSRRRLLMYWLVMAIMMCSCERPVSDKVATASASDVDQEPPAVATESAPLRDQLVEHFVLIQQRETGGARVRLRKILNRDPDDGQAAFLFGLSYHREKRYALARPWFEQAIEHAPDYQPTYYFLGWCLYYLGDTAASGEAFQQHQRFNPNEADTHFALGLLDLDADRLDAAEQRFRHTIALLKSAEDRAKDLSKAHARLADVMIRRGEFESAKVELKLATNLYEDHYEAHYKLFRVLTRLGELEAALEAQHAFLDARQRVHPTTSFPE